MRAIKSISPQPILIVSTAVEMAELQGCKATAVCVASEHACMIRLCRANSEGILYSPATQMVGSLYKHKKSDLLSQVAFVVPPGIDVSL